MHKKNISILLAITLLICALPSCSKEPADGTISDVEIEQPASEEPSETIFTKIDSPYEYEYTTFTIEKARMRFDFPDTWEVRAENSRWITIQTPEGDPYLPDTTINILCGYGENVDANEMSQYTMNNHAYNFPIYFKDELAGLTTRTGGLTRHLRRYEDEDNIYNCLEFVSDDHAEDAATLTVDDVVLVDDAANYYYNECGMVSTFVKWDHSPFCFNAVVKEAYLDAARSMIEYMVSSISYEDPSGEEYKSVEYKKEFSTWVPSSFVPIQGAENIFTSSLYDNKETAGISIGVFSVDGFSRVSIDEEIIANYYSQQIASLIFGGYSDIAQYGIQIEPATEEDGPDFNGPIAVDCSGYSDPTEISGTVFGVTAYYYCDYYVVEKDDQTFLITVVYQNCQKDLARVAGKTAVRKLKVK